MPAVPQGSNLQIYKGKYPGITLPGFLSTKQQNGSLHFGLEIKNPPHVEGERKIHISTTN